MLSSCKSIEKTYLNSPLKDNNNNKFSSPGIKAKGIKYCEIVPYNVKDGVSVKKKDSYRIYFDMGGRYFKEEKYHMGHLVEYTAYYFDNVGNLKQAIKYLLFPERTVSAKAEFSYDRNNNVTLYHISEGEDYIKKFKTYDKDGNVLTQKIERRLTDEKTLKVRKRNSTRRYQYVKDDSNRVLEKLVYDGKTDRFKGKIVNDWKGQKISSSATYSASGKLRRMTLYEYDNSGKTTKEVILGPESEKEDEIELIYDKMGNLIQRNSVLDNFEKLGTKSKFNKQGNIIREELYDPRNNKIVQVWKYTYFKE